MAAKIKTVVGNCYEIRNQNLSFIGNIEKQNHVLPIKLVYMLFQWFKEDYPTPMYLPPWKRDNCMAEDFAKTIDASVIWYGSDPIRQEMLSA